MSDGDGRALPSYDDLLQEVQELRAENGRLRDLLGFEERSSDGHVQAWAPTLLAEPSERPVVDASSSTGGQACAVLVAVRGPLRCLRPPVGEHFDRQVRLVAGDEGADGRRGDRPRTTCR